jgi:hypothetical protein
MPFDTTVDTTQGATRRNRRQPPAKKSAYVCRFCNIQQRLETDDIGLWLRRSRVRAPSVTLLNFLQIPEKGEASGLVAGGFGSSRAAVDQPNASSSAVAATLLIPGITCE